MSESGVVVVDKPAGISSAAVVGKVKKLFRPLPVGHAGTLDPFATGVLVCLVGRATKLAQYAQGGMKTYTGTIRFGLTTTTDDVTGDAVKEDLPLPSLDECYNVAPQFIGTIEQVPPQISALKVDGKRAYKIARSGKTAELAGREVVVQSFELQTHHGTSTAVEAIDFRVVCGKGTYIRAIARDMGELLGTGGCLQSLRREASVPFSLSGASLLEELEMSALQSWDIMFPHAPRITVSEDECRALAGGDQRGMPALVQRHSLGEGHQQPIVYIQEGSGKPGGILVFRGGAWKLGVAIAGVEKGDRREKEGRHRGNVTPRSNQGTLCSNEVRGGSTQESMC